MDNLQIALLTLQVFVAVILIILVLIQKSGSDSLGGIGGSSSAVGSVMSGKAKANTLTKITSILIAIFMINCLVLTTISKNKNSDLKSKLDNAAKQQQEIEKTTKPTNIPEIPPVQ